MILRSGRRLIMADNNVVRHQLTYNSTGVTKFKGREPDGTLKQSVETFLSSVDYHLQSRRITVDAQLQEAKSFLDLANGDIGDYVLTGAFIDCTTWAQFKTALRRTYASTKSECPILSLREIIRDCTRNHKTFINHVGRLSTSLNGWSEKLLATTWENGDAITIERLTKLLKITIALCGLPDNLVQNFDLQISPDTNELDLIEQVKKHQSKCETFDMSILGSNKPALMGAFGSNNYSPSTSKPNYQGHNNQGNSRFNSRNTYQSYNGSSRYQSNSKGNPQYCFNCGMSNHFANVCRNNSYCTYHNVEGHRTSDCRAKNQRYNGNSRSNSQNRYHNNQSNQGTGRSASPSPSRNTWANRQPRAATPARQNVNSRNFWKNDQGQVQT